MPKIKRALLHHSLWYSRQRKAPSGEEGLALLLALLTGLTLLTGATGLLIRQLMARKLGASESYQQMAEAAAVNGFNRILSKLNQNDPENYRGFLFTLNNQKNTNNPNDGFSWELINTTEAKPLEELCTDTSMGLPIHPSSETAKWPTGHVGKGNTETIISVPFIDDETRTQRQDGKGSIQTFYRLRDYLSPGKNGLGEGVFQIEGIAKRVGSSDEDYLARTLLTRSLYISSSVVRPEDWGVLAAQHIDLGPANISGAGLILWDVESPNSFQRKGGCDDNTLKAGIQGQSSAVADRIWPVLNRGLPSTALYDKNKVIDTMPSDSGATRVWSIDDTGNNSNFNCGADQIVCTRANHSQTTSAPPGIQITSKVSSTGQTSQQASNGFTWDATLACIYNWCYTGKPTLRDGYSWYKSSIYYKTWKSWTTQAQKEWEVRIRQNDICSNQNGECHLYVEHINIKNTRVLIENDNKPIVLHLELPVSGSTPTNLSGRIELSESSLLCGVNSGQTTCNNRPESFVITSSKGDAPSDCATNRVLDDPYVLSVAGNSLPAAWVALGKGTFTLSSDAEMRGVIWANSFCSKDHSLNLITDRADGGEGSVTRAAEELWQWSTYGFKGYGRTVARGIRGTGLDTFRRW
ncbi:hypothetical protein PMIT1323_00844 [Prochlorococcus marinus str. MIT 1323]|nr:hypothetical protein PMIT1323_00844 [Prochlorococcus marinus str. MIT 1323]